MRTWSVGMPNLRHGQSLRGGRVGEVGLREGTGEIICLKIPLKRGKRWAIVNFERELIAFIFPNSNVLVAIVRHLQVVKLYSSTSVQFLMGQGCQLTVFHWLGVRCCYYCYHAWWWCVRMVGGVLMHLWQHCQLPSQLPLEPECSQCLDRSVSLIWFPHYALVMLCFWGGSVSEWLACWTQAQ